MNNIVYTIGHSNHEIDYFLTLLTAHHINCLIDVRSVPASAYNPQFNKPNLKNTLASKDIIYMHFGKEFGARQEQFELLDEEGIVSFERFQQTKQFRIGVERVHKGILKGYKIALMCSEGNPLECHRFSMVARVLEGEGITVLHILKDNELKSHQALEQNLIIQYDKKLPKKNLFEPGLTETETLEMVYHLHNKDIGWRNA